VWCTAIQNENFKVCSFYTLRISSEGGWWLDWIKMSKWVKIFCLINIFTGPGQNWQNFMFIFVFLAKILSCRSNRASLVYRNGALVGTISNAWLLVESGAGGFFRCGPSVGSFLVACGRFI
jgi:hypothetical protein